jgi:CheY-like chemotaxis protein
MGHAEALAWAGKWEGIDAVIVDAADERRAGDQFPGVSVVRRVRDAAQSTRPLVVVVTGHSLHDGLRHRMAQAEADLYFSRSDISSAEKLVDILRRPEQWRRQRPPSEAPSTLAALGVEGADVNRFVAYVEERGLAEALDLGQPTRLDPRSRKWLRHRQELAQAAGIEPVNLTTGDRPREWDAPSLRQLSRIWAWAARIGRGRR